MHGEVMASHVIDKPVAISSCTLAVLEEIGWAVDYELADPFKASSGILVKPLPGTLEIRGVKFALDRR